MAKDKMFAQTIDFDLPIQVIDWSNNKLLYSLPCFLGLLAMSESRRWDNAHATAQVRVLAEADRIAANAHHDGPETPIPAAYPVYFTQDKVVNRDFCGVIE